jgi:hypothetical protein
VFLENSSFIAPIAIYGSGGSPPFYSATAYQKIHSYTPPYYIPPNWYFATPWMWLDGDKDAGWTVFSQSTLNSLAIQRMAVPSGLEIEIGGGINSTNDTLNLVFYVTNTDTQAITGHFHAVLTEDNLSWSAPNGQQIHDFVPRIWWPDAQGSQMTILPGIPTTINTEWLIDQNWVINELSVVAFVQSNQLQPDSTLEIHQGAKVKVTELTAIPGEDYNTIAEEFQLFQNFPNPFNPTTTIEYFLSKRSQVSLKIFDLLGQEVRSLVDNIQGPGNYSIVWEGRDNLGENVASGIYIYTLQAGKSIQYRKMILLR